ncbi:hypothetical protein F4810DRAFT_691398 [Camillea tinctor]|nr:hypothetical protein F4810DRAFT_691398 [Camillea tinctor]
MGSQEVDIELCLVEHLNKSLKCGKHKESQNSHSFKCSDLQPDLNSPEFRTILGHVTRRNDRVERAEPPPPPPPRQVPTIPKSNRSRRKRQRNNLENNSDSDSDSDRDNRKRDADDSGPVTVAQKGTPEERNDKDIYPWPKSEEEERIQQQRALRKTREKWEELSSLRSRQRKERKKRQMILLDEQHNKKLRSPFINRYVLTRSRRLREHLDEVLYDTLEGNKVILEDIRSTTVKYVVKQVEEAIFKQFAEFDRSQNLPTIPRLEAVISNIVKEFENNLSSKPLELIWDEIYSRFKYHCPEPLPEDASMDEFSTWRVENLVGEILEKAIYHLDHIKTSNTWSNHIDDMSSDSVPSRKPKLSYFEDELRCHQTYSEWILSKTGLSIIDAHCIEKYRQEVESALSDFKKSMASANLKVTQEFCVGIVNPREISLVLVKGSHLASIWNIPEEKLKWLGWYTGGLDSGYWRCEPVNHKDRPPNIWKVDMDGRVLGAFCRTGSEWCFLGCDTVTEYRSMALRLRGLTRFEEEALGLREEIHNAYLQ